MTDTPSEDEKKAGHAFINWARRWAFHPTVVLVARVGVAALAFGLGTAATYVISIDSRVKAVEGKIDKTILGFDTKFSTIDGQFVLVDQAFDSITNRIDNGREDRLTFQSDALAALNKLVDGMAATQSAIAAQAERDKAIEDRLSRIERKIDN